MKWKCSDLKCIRKPTWSRLSLTHWQIQPFSRVKSLDGPRVPAISPVGKKKVCGGKNLLKSQALTSEWNTERVREDASGDSEDGEDDELPCVIGESAGDLLKYLSTDSLHVFVWHGRVTGVETNVLQCRLEKLLENKTSKNIRSGSTETRMCPEKHTVSTWPKLNRSSNFFHC